MLLAGSTTATTTAHAMSTVDEAGPSTTNLGCALILGSLSCSREVLAQLSNLGELAVVTSEYVVGEGGNPGDG